MRGFKGPPFEELLRTFDRTIWTLVLISSIFVACCLAGIEAEKKNTFATTFLSCTKTLMEQCTPFVQKHTESDYPKPIIGTYLLVALVLSNGYKNRNVYKMIAKRDVMTFQRFTELVTDNFSVYT